MDGVLDATGIATLQAATRWYAETMTWVMSYGEAPRSRPIPPDQVTERLAAAPDFLCEQTLYEALQELSAQLLMTARSVLDPE